MNPVTGLNYDLYSRTASVNNRGGAVVDKVSSEPLSLRADPEFIPASHNYSAGYASEEQTQSTSLYGQKAGSDEQKKGRFVDIHV